MKDRKTQVAIDGDNALVAAIQDGVKTETIELDGLSYFTREVFLPPNEELAAPIQIHTLAGLVDFIKNNVDGLVLNTLFLHVVSETEVKLRGVLQGRDRNRDNYVTANFENLIGKTEFRFGQFMPIEVFNIALASLFLQSEQRDSVMQLLGNIKDEQVNTIGDDGFTQEVTVRTGIAKVGNVEVKNPVTLRPFRTFREIQQPASEFILRLKQQSGGMPQVALFEADGGAWKLDAIASIKLFLEVQLSEQNSRIAIVA